MPTKPNTNKKGKINILFIGLLVVIAFIILPTATPEDLVTTAPMILILGLRTYLIIAAAILSLLLLATILNGKKYMALKIRSVRRKIMG